jgi:hypothetical protein
MAVSIATNTSYLELPTDVRYATLQQFTVCGWFMLNDVTAVSYRGMWSLGLAGANGRVWAAVDATTLKPAGNAFDGTLAKYTQTNMGGSVMTNKSGVWIYFAYWFDLTQSTVESNLVFPFLIDCYWPGDPVLTPDVGASGTVVLPAAGTFRVGQDHDGDSMRGGAQNVRMFDRLLTIQEIRDNMYASDCPYDLRQSCPIDLPLDVDGRNLGYVGGIATATGTVAFGSGATLPPAPLPLRFRGAVKPSGVIVTGAQATETDTANAGTPSITVAATRASETDTGAAGAAAVTIAAGRATETDTGASGTAAVAVASVRAIETDTGSAGTALIRPAGTQATETDTGTHGAIALNKAGAMATETDTGATGTPAIKPAGSLISETDTGAHGVPAVALPSNRATETDTGASGTAAITVVATRVTETDTGATGTPALRPSGTLVAETDSASAGASNVRPQGLQAQETDTASHGLSGAVVLGTLATETDTASSGTSAIQPHGSLMSETVPI